MSYDFIFFYKGQLYCRDEHRNTWYTNRNLLKFINILTSLYISEIPGNLLAQLLLNRMKRRILLFVAFILAALSIIATQFIPKEYSWLVLLCFVIGKGSITIAFTTLSLYTAEQWPTSIRNTIMNTCSMIGRTGSMLAPFAAILVN